MKEKSAFQPLNGRRPAPPVSAEAREWIRRTEYKGMRGGRAVCEYLYDLEKIVITPNELSQGLGGNRYFTFAAQQRLCEVIGMNHRDVFGEGYPADEHEQAA